MKMRKKFKTSPLIYPASCPNAGSVVQTYDCRLNQSPWDVMSFSPSSTLPSQPLPTFRPPVKESDDRALHESPPDVIPIVDKKIKVAGSHQYSDGNTTVDKAKKQPKYAKDKPIIQCCRTDGRSWKCQREAAKGHKLCEHHLSLIRKNNLNHSNKQGKSIDKPQQRSGSKRASASAPFNQNDFYYYSGFGPRWGKKRGRVSKNIDSDVPKNVEHKSSPSSRLDKYVDVVDKKNEGQTNIKSRQKRVRKCVDRLNL